MSRISNELKASHLAVQKSNKREKIRDDPSHSRNLPHSLLVRRKLSEFDPALPGFLQCALISPGTLFRLPMSTDHLTQCQVDACVADKKSSTSLFRTTQREAVSTDIANRLLCLATDDSEREMIVTVAVPQLRWIVHSAEFGVMFDKHKTLPGALLPKMPASLGQQHEQNIDCNASKHRESQVFPRTACELDFFD